LNLRRRRRRRIGLRLAIFALLFRRRLIILVTLLVLTLLALTLLVLILLALTLFVLTTILTLVIFIRVPNLNNQSHVSG
jgi:hypothetical protein